MSPRDTADQSALPPVLPAGLSPALRAFVLGNNVPSTALAAAQDQADGVGQRRIDIPVRKSFVRVWDDASADSAPLARIYAGGRSGIVAVKLYIALLWRCAAPPYQTDKPARAWATLLGLTDPTGKGARRVTDALKTLASAQLVKITAQPGHPNMIEIRMEDGSGRAYSPPSTAFQFARTDVQKRTHMYSKLSRELWLDGTFQSLSGPATVMLLILLAERADRELVWFSTTAFPARYRISHKTRAAGTAELVSRKLLEVDRQVLPATRNSSVFDPVRKRTRYRLVGHARTGPVETLDW